jgi:hypothetical protein
MPGEQAVRDHFARDCMRGLVALCLCSVTVACDPVRQVGIAVEPSPAVATDSARRAALDLAARIADRHRLTRATSRPRAVWPRPRAVWQECFARGNLTICGRPTERGVLFRLHEALTPSWTAGADSVRRELLAGLKEAFGEGAVRECSWREDRDPRRAGCDP